MLGSGSPPAQPSQPHLPVLEKTVRALSFRPDRRRLLPSLLHGDVASLLGRRISFPGSGPRPLHFLRDPGLLVPHCPLRLHRGPSRCISAPQCGTCGSPTPTPPAAGLALSLPFPGKLLGGKARRLRLCALPRGISTFRKWASSAPAWFPKVTSQTA